jgi:PST family polysaccharide transporter
MGFILLAKARRDLFFFSELATNAAYMGMVWLGVKYFGLNGAGMGYLGLYLFYFVLIFLIVHKLTGFSFSAENKRIMAVFLPLMGGIFASWYFLPHLLSGLLGLAGALFTGIYSLKKMSSMVSHHRFPKPIQKLFSLLGLQPKSSHD